MTLCCCKIPCNIPCKVDPLYIYLFSKLVKNHSIIFSLQTKDLLILKILLQLFQFSDINNFYKSMLLCMLVLNISWIFFSEKRIKDIQSLNGHMQSIIDSKSQLKTGLQQPFVGDFVKIEAQYHRQVLL